MRATAAALVAATVFAAGSRPAAADATGEAASGGDTEAAIAAAATYFAGERAQGAAWSAVGAVAITTGALALARGDDLARGAGYPLLAVGVIQLGAGVVSYLSPPRRSRRIRAALARDPQAIGGELRRMRRVEFAFDALRVTEVALIAVGAGLVIGGARADRDVLVGIGGGLGFQALAMLALDAAAEDRAARYVERLSIAAGGGVVAVGYAAPF